MSNSKSKDALTRSDQRIPKLRTRGRANRQRLLDEAQRLIEAHGGRPIRFSEVFEAAGVSRGSAYRIYNGIEDLMQDLSSTWINNFVEFVKDVDPIDQPGSWVELSDHVVRRSAAYWVETAETLRVLPRVRSNVPESYRSAVRELTQAIADVFDRHFIMPEIEEWPATLSMYTSLGDSIFSDAVRRHGRITEQRLGEAQKICSTYLSFFLPTRIEPRGN